MIPNKQLKRIVLKEYDGCWIKTQFYAETLQEAESRFSSSGTASYCRQVGLLLDEAISIVTTPEKKDDV